jgi:hypothetical protein
MKIYLATSWRTRTQPSVLQFLREAGHEVYDFRDPRDIGQLDGFHWSEIDSNWQGWDSTRYIRALNHPKAITGFQSDMDALHWCDACVLLLPCGRSAHWELGWASGAGKRTAVILESHPVPELMYKGADFLARNVDEIIYWLQEKR